MKKLVVFDFDSTLMDGETIDFLAEPLGLKEKVAAITESAMRGELDFFESLTTRVRLLEGLSVETVDTVCRNLPLMPGAKETVAKLKEAGHRVVVFSGGFRNATSHFREILGYDADFSNILHARHDKLTGLVGGDMMFDFSKGDMLVRLQNLLGATPERTVAIGDGANDLSMFAHAGLKIAFCAKTVLKEAADIAVERKDLTQVLAHIEP